MGYQWIPCQFSAVMAYAQVIPGVWLVTPKLLRQIGKLFELLLLITYFLLAIYTIYQLWVDSPLIGSKQQSCPFASLCHNSNCCLAG